MTVTRTMQSQHGMDEKSKGGRFRSISRARGRRSGVMVVVATVAAAVAGFRTMTAGAIVTVDVGGHAQHLETVIAIGIAATET